MTLTSVEKAIEFHVRAPVSIVQNKTFAVRMKNRSSYLTDAYAEVFCGPGVGGNMVVPYMANSPPLFVRSSNPLFSPPPAAAR